MTERMSLATVELGGVVHAKYLNKIYYMISDPDDILTAANGCLEKHFAYQYMKPCLGNGLLTSPVDIWKHHRKFIMPTFSPPVVNGFIKDFNAQGRKLVADLEYFVGKEQFNPNMIVRKHCLESLCLTALGVEVHKDHIFLEEFIQSVDSLESLIMLRFQRPWFFNDFLFKSFGYKDREIELEIILQKLPRMLIARRKQITADALLVAENNEAKRDATTNGSTNKILLDLLLELLNENIISEQEVIDEVNTMMMATYETVTTTLLVIFMFLGSYSEVQQRVYEEISQELETDRDIEKDDMKKLKYLEAVILEALRMIPNLPIIPRLVDTPVKLKNYTLRPGSYCLLSPMGLHRNSLWDNPAQFSPDRWMNSDAIPKNCFMGFSTGKRNCVGKAYAMVLMKVTLGQLLKKYKIETSEKNFTISVKASTTVEGTISLSHRKPLESNEQW